ncbi:MAG TPA: hypothetical protein VGM69_14745 [Chloroflexota bacterium]|jgi:membrane associated rhomboid family serine protease
MIPLGDENRPGRLTPVVTFLLIALNVLVFLVELTQPDVEAFVRAWGTVPGRIRAGQGYETLISSSPWSAAISPD